MAESILSGYKRPVDLSHLPALGLLRGVATSYIGSGKLDQASRICEIAIQGYKTFSPEYASEYDSSLGLLASVYEKTGRLAEAEAIRNSLGDKHSWGLPGD